MADLKETAEKFLEDLIVQNIGGLMATFTPEGMSKAMAMGQQSPPGGTPTKKEVNIGEPQGDDHPVEFVVGNDTQEAVIGTLWREVGGAWKVNDIELKKAP